jgi:hypothetical protein
VPGTSKAVNLPRSAAGTELSAMLKSRTCSSYTTMSSGASMAGLTIVSHPAGLRSASSRLTNWLRTLSVARLTEYGSVTSLVTSASTAGE